MKALLLLMACGVLSLAAMACDNASEPTETTPAPTASYPPSPLPENSDVLIAEIANEVPGFAGLSEEAGRNVLVVRSTRPDIDMQALRTAIDARFPLLAHMDIDLLIVDYDFGQLSDWYEQIDPVWSAPGLIGQVSYTDIDEVANVIKVGVYTEAAVEAANRELARIGIPADAVQVVLTERGSFPGASP